MTAQKEQRGFSNFGFSTILLSFVMICVVTFSVLSLITAHSDYKLSKKVADKTMGYYAAEEIIYEKLAAWDNLLVESYLSAPNETAYYSAIADKVTDFGTFDAAFETTSEGCYLILTEDIAEDHHLSVKLSILYPTEAADTFYQITEWKSVYTTEPPEDAFLNLIQ